MVNRWLLIETFDDSKSPSIIGMGSAPKGMVPLPTLLGRGRNLIQVETAITEVVRSHSPAVIESDDSHLVIAHPLVAYTGRVHGAYVWAGSSKELPPPRDLAGVWQFNLTTDIIGGSDDLLDLYAVRPEDRRTERATAEAFERLIPNADASSALAILIRSRPGDHHQAVWGIRRDDGALRAGHLSCRAVEEWHRGQRHVVLRGITHDIGAAEDTAAAPPPPLLEQRLLKSMAETGTYRVLMNLDPLRILQWIDEPLPGLAWRRGESETLEHPWVHPDDQKQADSLRRQLSAGPATANLRLASIDGGWVPVRIDAKLVELDEQVHAGLFILRPQTRVAPL